MTGMSEAQSSNDHMLEPPRLNERYVITSLIGRGAHARVYMGFDERLKQWRAIKVLNASAVDDEDAHRRFSHEAQSMARLSHENVLRVVDIDRHGALPFIVMELARGGSIYDWLDRQGPMDPTLACRVLRQACAGLSHAHQHGIVHRDVKPHNLLVMDTERIVVTDFGIAQLSDEMSATKTGSIMGTFAYMAPEQRSDTKSVDHRADVYGLGATLYTLVTHKTSAELFFAETNAAMLDGVPDPLRELILDACRYEPDDRIGSVEELSDRLELAVGDMTEPAIDVSVMDVSLPLPDMVPEAIDPRDGLDALIAAVQVGSTSPTEGHLEDVSDAPSYSDGGAYGASLVIPYSMPSTKVTPGRTHRYQSVTDLAEDRAPDYVDLDDYERTQSLLSMTPPGAPPAHPTAKAKPRVSSPSSAETWRWGVALLLVLLVVGPTTSIGGKMWVAANERVAAERLVARCFRDKVLMARLVSEGGDEATLADRWDVFERASGADKAEAAHALTVLYLQEAERIRAPELIRLKVAALVRNADEWEAAHQQLEETGRSWWARATGRLGL